MIGKKLLWLCLILGLMVTLALTYSQPAAQGQAPTATSDRVPISIANIDQLQLIGASLVEIDRTTNGLPDFTQSGNKLMGVPVRASAFDTSTQEIWRFADTTRQFVLSPDEQTALVLHQNPSDPRDSLYSLWHMDNSPADLNEIAILGSTNHYRIEAYAYQFSGDSQRIAIAQISRDTPIYVWDVQSGSRFPAIEDYTVRSSQQSMKLNDGGSILAITSNQTIRLWDVQTGQRFATMEVPNSTIFPFSFSPDGNTFIYKGSDNRLHIYDLVSRSEDISFLFGNRGEYEYHLSSDESTVALFGSDVHNRPKFLIYDTATGDIIHRFATAGAESVVYRRNEDTLAVWLTERSQIEVWDIQTSELLQSVYVPAEAAYQQNATEFELSRDNHVLVIRNAQEIWLFDLRENRPLTINVTPSNNFRTNFYEHAFDFTYDDTVMITADIGNASVQLWDVQTGEFLLSVPGYEFTLSPDGTTLVVATSWRTPEALMFYGIPSDGRAVRPAIPGRVMNEGINLRSAPVVNGPRTDIIEGLIVAAGRSSDNTHVFLSSHNGWARAGAPYIELVLDFTLDALPVFDSSPAWAVTSAQIAPTFMPISDASIPTSVAVAAPITTPTAIPQSPTAQPSPEVPAETSEVAAIPPAENETHPDSPANVQAINADNVNDVRLLSVIEGDTVALAQNGAYLIVHRGTVIELWQVSTLTKITEYEGGEIMQVVGNGRYVIFWQRQDSSQTPTDLWIWDLNDPENVEPIMLATLPIQTIVSDVHGKFLIINNYVGRNQQIEVWHTSDQRQIGIYTGYMNFIRISPDGKRLVLGNTRYSSSGNPFLNITNIQLIDLESGVVLADLIGTENANSDVYFSADSSHVAVGGNQVRIWDTATGDLLFDISTRAEKVYITHDNQRVLTFSPNTTLLRIWDLRGDNAVELGQLRDSVLSFTMNPQDSAVATINSDQTVHVWDIQSGEEIGAVDRQLDLVAVSADSRYLTGAYGQEVWVYDLVNNAELPSIGNVPAEITKLEFSTEGNFLEMTLADHTLRHLDVANPSILLPITYNLAGHTLRNVVSPLGFWVGDDTSTGRFVQMPTGFSDESIHYVSGGRWINFSTLPPQLIISPDGATILASTVSQGYRRPLSIMVFGIPTPERPAWQPIEAHLAAESVHLRTNPHSNAEIISYLFSDEPIFIGGQYDNHFYLPELGGWIRAEAIYVDLDDTARAQIPTLNDPSE